MAKTDDEGTEKLHAPADFNGPTGDRHCTDVLCTLLIIVMWIVMTALGGYSIANGDYRVVLYPLDYDGNICGTDVGDIDMTDYPYLYYINSYSGGVCVKECPTMEGVTADGLTDVYTLVTYGGIFSTDQSEVSPTYIQVANYTNSSNLVETCTLENCYPGQGTPEESYNSEGINQGWGYAWYAYDTYEVLWRCLGTDEASDRIRNLTNQDAGEEMLSVNDAGGDFWNNLYADLWIARDYILGFGFCVALIIGFCYAMVLRIPWVLTLMVWGSIILTIFMIIAAGAYAYNQANQWDDVDPQVYSDTTITAARVSSYVLFVLGGILFFLMICLRKQIQLAIGCVKETSKALVAMPAIMFLPVLQAAGLIAFMVIWTVYAVFLSSIGEYSVTEYEMNGYAISMRDFEYDDFVERSAWYLLFCFYWTSQFIVALGEIMVAMCVAKWYFARDKSTVGNGTVCGSFTDTLWYHSGTAAFGSLILALIKLLRAILARVQEKVKQADSKIADALLCCCQCCLWCFEKCVKFLNKNAYIQTAIFGTSFCKSAREAFFLILRNAARVGAITYVSEAIVIVGKLFISAVTTVCSYYLMNEMIGDELYSVVGPIIFIFLISYFVASMFMSVFDMGIAAILQCFVADEEMFDGDERYADGALKDWVNKHDTS